MSSPTNATNNPTERLYGWPSENFRSMPSTMSVTSMDVTFAIYRSSRIWLEVNWENTLRDSAQRFLFSAKFAARSIEGVNLISILVSRNSICRNSSNIMVKLLNILQRKWWCTSVKQRRLVFVLNPAAWADIDKAARVISKVWLQLEITDNQLSAEAVVMSLKAKKKLISVPTAMKTIVQFASVIIFTMTFRN